MRFLGHRASPRGHSYAEFKVTTLNVRFLGHSGPIHQPRRTSGFDPKRELKLSALLFVVTLAP
jgi:hypothetical protein